MITASTAPSWTANGAATQIFDLPTMTCWPWPLCLAPAAASPPVSCTWNLPMPTPARCWPAPPAYGEHCGRAVHGMGLDTRRDRAAQAATTSWPSRRTTRRMRFWPSAAATVSRSGRIQMAVDDRVIDGTMAMQITYQRIGGYLTRFFLLVGRAGQPCWPRWPCGRCLAKWRCTVLFLCWCSALDCCTALCCRLMPRPTKNTTSTRALRWPATGPTTCPTTSGGWVRCPLDDELPPRR